MRFRHWFEPQSTRTIATGKPNCSSYSRRISATRTASPTKEVAKIAYSAPPLGSASALDSTAAPPLDAAVTGSAFVARDRAPDALPSDTVPRFAGVAFAGGDFAGADFVAAGGSADGMSGEEVRAGPEEPSSGELVGP
jgi:hypothetical protein